MSKLIFAVLGATHKSFGERLDSRSRSLHSKKKKKKYSRHREQKFPRFLLRNNPAKRPGKEEVDKAEWSWNDASFTARWSRSFVLDWNEPAYLAQFNEIHENFKLHSYICSIERNCLNELFLRSFVVCVNNTWWTNTHEQLQTNQSHPWFRTNLEEMVQHSRLLDSLDYWNKLS